MTKTLAQTVYEADLAVSPLYHDGTARKPWDQLPDYAQKSWAKNPTPLPDQAPKHGQIFEYGNPNNPPMARSSVIESRSINGKVYQLYELSAGLELAGSALRYQGHTIYGVRYEVQGTRYGKRFITLDMARVYFDKITTEAGV